MKDEKEEKKPVAKPVEVVKKKELKGSLRVTVRSQFSDGNLYPFFEELGYSGDWQANEERTLPGWLIERVQNSGGEVEFLA